MARVHINNDGQASQCRAEAGRCPFRAEDGSESPHYTSLEEGRAAYEERNKGNTIQSLSKEKAKSNAPATETKTTASTIEIFNKLAKRSPELYTQRFQNKWMKTYEKLNTYEKDYGDPRNVKVPNNILSSHARQTHKMRRLRDGLDAINSGAATPWGVLANNGNKPAPSKETMAIRNAEERLKQAEEAVDRVPNIRRSIMQQTIPVENQKAGAYLYGKTLTEEDASLFNELNESKAAEKKFIAYNESQGIPRDAYDYELENYYRYQKAVASKIVEKLPKIDDENERKRLGKAQADFQAVKENSFGYKEFFKN